MAAISFRRAQNSEILTHVVQDLRRCPPDRLQPVIVGSNAVDTIQSVRTVTVGAMLLVQRLDRADLLKLLGVGPVGLLFFHLAVRIAATLQRLQWLLQRLRYVPIVNHAPPQIDDLIDVLHQQRTFCFTSAASSAGPDFVFGIYAAN